MAHHLVPQPRSCAQRDQTDADLRAMFSDIRTLYFSRWDRHREWTTLFGDAEQTRKQTGYCDSSSKTVYLDQHTFLSMPCAGQIALLIHEICHDVAAAHHNRKWAMRMKRAAVRAEKLKETRVAAILRSDIFSCAGNGVLEEYSLRNVVEIAAELSDREPNYASVLLRVAKYFGHAPAKVNRDYGRVIENSMG